MTETNEPIETPEPVDTSAPIDAPAPYDAGVPAPPPPAPAPLAPMDGPADGPVGQIRPTGACVLLTIVTLGFYTWYWYYKTHDEMKRHTGYGLGGGLALVLAIFVNFLMPFFSASEAGQLYERKGQPKPVSGYTGLWYILLGWFFFVGAIVWFVKTNKAINDYWAAQGATAA